MSDTQSYEMVSWERVEELVLELANRIQHDGYQPDIIIAIGRGGYVPGRLLADYLDSMNLTSIKIEHYVASHKQPVTTIIYPLSTNVTNQNVLLVDDVSDSGDTFTVALEHIQQRSSPKEVRTAVVHHKRTSSYIPYYYGEELIEWSWLIYPWAQVEDISVLVSEMAPRPGSVEEIARRLEKAHGIRIKNTLLKYILENLREDQHESSS